MSEVTHLGNTAHTAPNSDISPPTMSHNHPNSNISLHVQRNLLVGAPMVAQHCLRKENGWVYAPSYMPSAEGAFETLVLCGLAVWTNPDRREIRLVVDYE